MRPCKRPALSVGVPGLSRCAHHRRASSLSSEPLDGSGDCTMTIDFARMFADLVALPPTTNPYQVRSGLASPQLTSQYILDTLDVRERKRRPL